MNIDTVVICFRKRMTAVLLIRGISMNSAQRRQNILKILSESDRAVSGKELASLLNVSRQVIVQDIALLRANGEDIYSTNVGYLRPAQTRVSRVFKTCHTDEEVVEELQLIVDCGGSVDDVFVYHKVYGVIRADLNIRSRVDIENFVRELASGRSSLLKNITSDFHYHTVTADSEAILDVIQEKLMQSGFLADLTEYEPVRFG